VAAEPARRSGVVVIRGVTQPRMQMPGLDQPARISRHDFIELIKTCISA
jgi:hypothetical protein